MNLRLAIALTLALFTQTTFAAKEKTSSLPRGRELLHGHCMMLKLDPSFKALNCNLEQNIDKEITSAKQECNQISHEEMSAEMPKREAYKALQELDQYNKIVVETLYKVTLWNCNMDGVVEQSRDGKTTRVQITR